MLNASYLYILITEMQKLCIYVILKREIQETCKKYLVYTAHGLFLLRRGSFGAVFEVVKNTAGINIPLMFSPFLSLSFKHVSPKDDSNLILVHFFSLYVPKEMSFSLLISIMNQFIQ